MKTRQQSARNKERREQGIEFRLWKRWRRERLEALLTGPYAVSVQALLAFLKTMTGPTALLDFIRSGPWCDADGDVRFEVLALVDAAIIARRECMGLPRFDDSIGDMPLNVFLLMREQLNHSRLTAAPPGAQPGSIDSTAKMQEHVTCQMI
jgi:hypothetical protein